LKKVICIAYCFMTAILVVSCSETSAPPIVPTKKAIIEHAVKFMTVEALEKVGYEHISGYNFRILFKNGSLYILNTKDFLLAKFNGDRLLRVFKTRDGQAPKEMITPFSLFRYNENTIAIFDEHKRSVFFFDSNLNLEREIRINSNYEKIARVGKNMVATFSSLEDDMFALLDENLQVIRTAIKTNKTFPFKRVYKHHLNEGFFLDGNMVSHSYSMFLYKNCKVNIHDISTGKLVAVLNWEQPFSPTAQSINKRKNCYYLYHVGKYGPYYVVHTSYSKTLIGSRRHRVIRIFNEKGDLRYKDNFGNIIITVSKESPDSKLYFMDDGDGISYIDIEEFMK